MFINEYHGSTSGSVFNVNSKSNKNEKKAEWHFQSISLFYNFDSQAALVKDR